MRLRIKDLATGKAVEAIARQPEAEGKISIHKQTQRQ